MELELDSALQLIRELAAERADVVIVGPTSSGAERIVDTLRIEGLSVCGHCSRRESEQGEWCTSECLVRYGPSSVGLMHVLLPRSLARVAHSLRPSKVVAFSCRYDIPTRRYVANVSEERLPVEGRNHLSTTDIRS